MRWCYQIIDSKERVLYQAGVFDTLEEAEAAGNVQREVMKHPGSNVELFVIPIRLRRLGAL